MSNAPDVWLHTEHGSNIGMSSAWWWSRGVTMQLHRILVEHNGSQEIMDGNLLLLALRQVIRGAEMSGRHAKTDAASGMIGQALNDFDNAIPGGKDARDVIEHFDEYTQGVGRLQQGHVRDPKKRVPNDQLAEDFRVGWRWDLTSEGRRPVLTVGPFDIDLINAEDASFRLQCNVYEALLTDEGRPIPPGWTYNVQRQGPMAPMKVEPDEGPQAENISPA